MMYPSTGPFRTGVLLSTLLIALLSGCASLPLADFDEPDVELIGLEPLPSQGMEARFLVKLRITNPNSIPFEIDGMAYDLYLREKKVFTGVNNEGFSVEAYGESTAELEVAAGVFGSLSLLRDLLSNPPAEGMPYRLNAKLSRSGIGGAIRVTKEGVVNLNGL
ncbi:MAG: LEA type 2 family protein [Pseudomonadota bacterium]